MNERRKMRAETTSKSGAFDRRKKSEFNFEHSQIESEMMSAMNAIGFFAIGLTFILILISYI